MRTKRIKSQQFNFLTNYRRKVAGMQISPPLNSLFSQSKLSHSIRLVLWGSSCSSFTQKSRRRRRRQIRHAHVLYDVWAVTLTDSQTVQQTRWKCARDSAHCQIILLVIDFSRCEACAAERGKDATAGWVHNCFCLLSVWNWMSVCFKTSRGTLSSICRACDYCHAQCSSFTRVKSTFATCARLASPSFLKRADEMSQLATFLIVSTCLFYALLFYAHETLYLQCCSGDNVVLSLTVPVWSKRTYHVSTRART